MANIRSPIEKLAGCYHLARFTDKIRLHLAGTLPEDYQMPLFHQRGVDGQFMEHFGLSKEELLEVVKDSNFDDEKVATWFQRRIGSDESKVKSWNEVSVNFGKPGHRMHKTLEWAKKNYESQCDDPNIDTVFKSIDWDEGRIPR